MAKGFEEPVRVYEVRWASRRYPVDAADSATIVSQHGEEATKMVRMFVRHTAVDYTAWRKVYDEFTPTRESMGVKGHAVYQDVDHPNSVTVTHDFDSLEAAQAFMNSDELREAMARAGVATEPEVWYTNPA